jgi:nucleotide-binding universal stress UspA family protein
MTVVVGYIPTPEGEAALLHAIEVARGRQARLVVVNSSRGDALVDPRYALDEQVEQLRSTLEAGGVDHQLVQSVRGREAAEEVIDAVEKHQAALVVIGIRRRTAVGKLIMGSTAQRILLEAPCPVLAVKAVR